MVKRPVEHLNNPRGAWLSFNLTPVQSKKPFLIITCMVYLCNSIATDNKIKIKLIKLISDNPKIPVYKLGFLNNWVNQPVWK